MHLVLIPTWYSSSPVDPRGVFIRNYASMFHNQGFDTRIFFYRSDHSTSKNDFPKAWHKLHSELEYGVEVSRWNSRSFPKIGSVFLKSWLTSGVKAFKEYIFKYGRPDLIHAHSYFSAILAHELNKHFNIPYIYTEHSTIFLKENFPKYLTRRLSAAIDSSMASIAVSNGLSQAMKQYKLSISHVLPNPVDTHLFQPSDQGKSKELFILSAGNKWYEKGMDVLAKAIQKTGNLNRIKLIVADTSTQSRKFFSDYKGALELKPMLPAEEFASLLKDSMFFISPSRYETFGTMLFEALCCGIPIVSTRTSGANSFIPEKNGLWIPKEDPNALAIGIDTMIENYMNYNPSSLRERILPIVSSSSVGSAYMEILKKSKSAILCSLNILRS